MKSKSLVFVAFAAWSILCWRWYVCGLMQTCGDQISPETEEVVAIPDERLDTFSGSQPQTQIPVGEKKPSGNPTAPPPKPVSPSNMDEVQMEEIEDRMVIYFPYKSSRKEDNAAIDTYLAGLARHLIASGEKVTITGHTDFVGEPGDNYNFGLRRAYGIRDILVKKGVSKSQIQCKSFGDRKPVATNDTPYGRYLNRRAEIRVGK
jgi:outer membrane protein OmpA-like peptidoglycan-associated protein